MQEAIGCHITFGELQVEIGRDARQKGHLGRSEISKSPVSLQDEHGYSFWKIIIHAFNIAQVDNSYQQDLDRIYQFINHHLSTPPKLPTSEFNNIALCIFLKRTLKVQEILAIQRFKVSIFADQTILLEELNQNCPLLFSSTLQQQDKIIIID
ncbi:hypothetical protein DFA_00410 [Cavenderia fasciculata]|uniref:Uncharacterized protein n=1 Tax=Cavenderia fasciculata TaxID=261658 RepID=F4PRQ0_CACFS|nr:uncharacterized protein DFA_00410 [Cavenderia fasciculata]EGG20549.1 hypothetical protein DFA_00410 [Cavenderia fasciculata]|eukprot:XP_004358399.1 hypothetical protein DFA_00410 [Cavenderia fasciculata]